ncbi:MAG TPA: SDR family oxidoreductase [Candidatus Latescibacteria bacterium]|nr:SDR family oxidoreductase [Candidatus Handelsmanbacteria bacterium]HIL12020.1 SDR family oxidoreductase [Candidatus Latescibacterota bacterium]
MQIRGREILGFAIENKACGLYWDLGKGEQSMELTGRRCLVTGGGRGIGRGIALSLAREGAKVALLARTETELDETAALVEQTGVEVLKLQADVSQREQVDAAIEKMLVAWGGVEVLVNNAGIQGPMGRVEEVDPEAWMQVMQVNLGGCFYATRKVLPTMIAQGYGKIINLSGGGAVGPRPFFSAYSASKAAVVRFSENVAGEVAKHNIDINSIAPGAVHTRMLDERLEAGTAVGEQEIEIDQRLVQEGGTDPERPAALVVYLASARSDGLSGRLLAAVWDPWEDFDIEAVMATEAFTVRRLKQEDC